MDGKKKKPKKKPKYSERTLAFFRRMRHPEDKERNEREIREERLQGPRKGGKPPDPEIRALMLSEGISRQAAWYRLRRATGRPTGRPRKNAASGAKKRAKPAPKPDVRPS